MDDWAAMRTGRLTNRQIAEYVGGGPEGGKYRSPIGTIETSDDNKHMTLTLDPALLTGAGALKAQDYTQREMAVELQKLGVRTPAGGTTWRLSQVQRVLARLPMEDRATS
jgi:hypothetical protein